ncbi:unnamed protein product [Lampetra planeri]
MPTASISGDYLNQSLGLPYVDFNGHLVLRIAISTGETEVAERDSPYHSRPMLMDGCHPSRRNGLTTARRVARERCRGESRRRRRLPQDERGPGRGWCEAEALASRAPLVELERQVRLLQPVPLSANHGTSLSSSRDHIARSSPTAHEEVDRPRGLTLVCSNATARPTQQQHQQPEPCLGYTADRGERLGPRALGPTRRGICLGARTSPHLLRHERDDNLTLHAALVVGGAAPRGPADSSLRASAEATKRNNVEQLAPRSLGTAAAPCAPPRPPRALGSAGIDPPKLDPAPPRIDPSG